MRGRAFCDNYDKDLEERIKIKEWLKHYKSCELDLDGFGRSAKVEFGVTKEVREESFRRNVYG